MEERCRRRTTRQRSAVCRERTSGCAWGATFKKLSGTVARDLCWGSEMRFRFIEDRRVDYPVTILCEVLGVSPAGYYAWRSRPESWRSVANRDLVDDIKRVHRDACELNPVHFFGGRSVRSARSVLGRPHLDAAKGVGGLGEILVEADEALTAFRLGQMQTIRKVHALPHPAQRLRRGGSIFQTRARQPREIGEGLGALGSGKPIDAPQHPLGLQQDCGADECVMVVDQPARLGSLSGIVAHQIADDEISIDCEHAGVSPRRRSPLPYPRSILPAPYRVGSQIRLSAGWAQRRASPSAIRPRGYPPPPVPFRRASAAVPGSPWEISPGPWSIRWWSVSAWRTWRLHSVRQK